MNCSSVLGSLVAKVPLCAYLRMLSAKELNSEPSSLLKNCLSLGGSDGSDKLSNDCAKSSVSDCSRRRSNRLLSIWCCGGRCGEDRGAVDVVDDDGEADAERPGEGERSPPPPPRVMERTHRLDSEIRVP